MFVKYQAEFKFSVVKNSLDGLSLEEINRRHAASISSDSLRRWCRLYQNTRSVVCDPAMYATRGRTVVLTTEEREFVAELVENDPSMYLAEIQQELLEKYDVSLCLQTISNELHKRLNLSQKTLRKVHPNQDAMQRASFIMLMAHINPECLVFTDECGICMNGIVRTRGWALVGHRTARVPQTRRLKRYNLIPAVALSGLVACAVLEENVNRTNFEFYLENILLPMMNPFPGPRSVLVMDNASFHHNGRIMELIEARGCRLFYLPAYSPDLNPIEKGFSVLKSRMKRYCELTGAPEDGEQIEIYAQMVFTSELMHSLFRGSGYMD